MGRKACLAFIVLFFSFSGQGRCDENYARRSILNDRVEIMVPRMLKALPEDVAAERSPTLIPTVIFMNKANTVCLAVTYKKLPIAVLHQENVQEIRNALQNQNYNDISWANKQVLKLELKEINGRNFGVRRIRGQQLLGEVIELQYFTSLDGYQLLFSFSYPAQEAEVWEPAIERIFGSVKLR